MMLHNKDGTTLMITDSSALVATIDYPTSGVVNETPMSTTRSGRISAIRADLETCSVAQVSSLFSTEDVQAIARLLNQQIEHTSHAAALQAHDQTGLITELKYACKLDAALARSAVFRKCEQIASEYFGAPCHYGFDHALFKQAGSGPVDWHQDQHYSKFDLNKQCLSFWIPLQAVSAENGGMEYAIGNFDLLPHTPVSKGSRAHYVRQAHRPSGATTSPELQPGDVCIHTPLSLHRSHPNRGQSTRGAWIIQFNRYGYSRFFQRGNLYRHIRRLYMLEPYQAIEMARD